MTSSLKNYFNFVNINNVNRYHITQVQYRIVYSQVSERYQFAENEEAERNYENTEKLILNIFAQNKNVKFDLSGSNYKQSVNKQINIIKT